MLGLGVFNESGPHFKPLSSPCFEGLCKGRAENGLYYNSKEAGCKVLSKGRKQAFINSIINGYFLNIINESVNGDC